MNNILIETINTILPTLLIKYIPIDDLSTRSLLAYPLSKLIVSLLVFIFDIISNLINFMTLYYFQKKYVILDNTMLYYKSFGKYIISNHIDKIKACKTIQEDYNTNFEAVEFCKTTIIDIFEKNNKKYKMHITIENKNSYKISCNTNVELIQEYIKNIHDRIALTCENYDLVIFKPLISINSENKNNISSFTGWNKNISKTNKRLINTILSDSVNKNFVEKIKIFLTKSQLQIYNEKGLPYKIGFLLYGEPGTGKTSIIKSVAVEYNLPIFTFSFDVINTTNMVNTANEMIYKYIKPGTPHIVAIEDIDTTNLARYNDIQVSTLLQLLDGIDEYHGRITIMTANNMSYLNNNPALIRPGRIDNIIHVTYCDENQIKGILKLHYGPIIDSLVLEKGILITSASLIQIITVIKDLDLVIKFLNETKKFDKITNSELNNLIAKQNKPNINEKTEININLEKKDSENKNSNFNKFPELKTSTDAFCYNIKVYDSFLKFSISIKLYCNIIIIRNLYAYNIDKYNEILKMLEKKAIDDDHLINKYNLEIDSIIKNNKVKFPEGRTSADSNTMNMAEIANIYKPNKIILLQHYKSMIYHCIKNLENLENLLLILKLQYECKLATETELIFNNLHILDYFDTLIKHPGNTIESKIFPHNVDTFCNIFGFYNHVELCDTVTFLGPNYILFAPYLYDFFDYTKIGLVYEKFFNNDGTKK